MTTDLSGGLPPTADHAVLEPPADDPWFGENHAWWIWDDAGGVGVHLYLKTLGHVTSFSQRRETVFAFLPDGSVLTNDQDGPGPTDPALVRGPNLLFRCVEPFRRWELHYDSTAQRTTSAAMRRGRLPIEAPVALAFDLDVTLVAPPWSLGTYSEGESLGWASQFFGGSRYEQLLTAEGTIRTADGDVAIRGTGMRTHRIGTRNTGSFPGHSWSTAWWPDGHSFGLHKFCGADGVALWQEAWVSDGGPRQPAEVIEAPLLSLDLPGEALPIRLRTASGPVTIDGELRATNFVTSAAPDPQKLCPGVDRDDTGGRVMSQGLARYTWEGVDGAGLGMVERSLRTAHLAPLLARGEAA
jgi:hypothetical protein